MGCVLDAKLFFAEKVELLLHNVFGRDIPADREAALAAIMDFYLCGDPAPSDAPEPPERLLDWAADSPKIWADFRVYAGIDFDRINMHWWEFRALFASLPPDAQIKDAISWRGLDLSEIEDPKQRMIYARRKQAVALDPVNYEAEFDDAMERRLRDGSGQ